LFQEGVTFASLALVIVDEQHRFGVHQRLALTEKASGQDTSSPVGTYRHADSPHSVHGGLCRPRLLCHRRTAPGTDTRANYAFR
jgi:hypothetical protein